jgi:hypothetical protein
MTKPGGAKAAAAGGAGKGVCGVMTLGGRRDTGGW